MKTIFITIFEGVESKNILRTDIFPTIRARKDLRVVFFVKEAARIPHHQKEFGGTASGVEYLAVPIVKSSGLDRFFQRLKFLLLRTKTTHLWRTMHLLDTGNHLAYYAGTIGNIILGRRMFIKISRFLDYYLVRNDDYGQYFDRYKPDLVLMANLFDEAEVHLLREAKKRRVRTVALINSWDRATSRCVLRLLPDKLIVFNGTVRRALLDHHDARDKDIFVAGVPHYDYHFRAPFTEREAFLKKLGVDPKKKMIVYCPFGVASSDSDWDIIDVLHRFRDQGRFGKDVEIFIRFPPNDILQEDELKKRPFMRFEHPGMLFSEKRSIDWDMREDDLKRLSDTLYHMALMICYASSISIEGAVFDKPVINMYYEMSKESWQRSPTRQYGKTHYIEALQTGGIRLVHSEEELVTWVNAYLADPSIDREGRHRLVEQQCAYTDGKSGKRIGEFILSQLA